MTDWNVVLADMVARNPWCAWLHERWILGVLNGSVQVQQHPTRADYIAVFVNGGHKDGTPNFLISTIDGGYLTKAEFTLRRPKGKRIRRRLPDYWREWGSFTPDLINSAPQLELKLEVM